MAPSRCISITFFRNLTLATEPRSRRSLSLKTTMRPLLRKADPPSRDGAGEDNVVTDRLQDLHQVAKHSVLEQNATRLSDVSTPTRIDRNRSRRCSWGGPVAYWSASAS